MTGRLRRRHWARVPGQVMVLVAALLGLVLVPLGLMVLAVNAQRADHAALAALVRRAALDGAGALADASLGMGTPMLAGGSAFCAGQTDTATAAGRACQTLQLGLQALFPGTHPRIDATDALRHTQVTVLDGTLTSPAEDPTTHQVYHYPTVCVAATMRVGVLENDGLGFTYQFHACAQTVFR